ncbi:prepilin peptidase [Vibrio sp. UCD-FRSSP16_10]|uniref:preprotein translocase subunit SecA n=1 Tax=unclassified Vibrio TaxID=2614977 RepID=UPI00080092DB|nr:MULTISPECIES: prepilin peptidase [unclassified Vibrio]OBT08536.1 prepilin peptidase [Vibrio sp. UCD-FRSSP16_30]OBT18066.1 prepilin peptidase [Vibrio sp. UCD-FRSSP16_10]
MYKRPQRRPSSVLERPQKVIETEKRMQRWWRTLTAYCARPLRASIWIYKPLLWRIKKRDAFYRALSSAQLDQQTIRLKQSLLRHGLTHSLTVEAFALIREVAGRELGMWHFDSQIMGGLAILHGNIGQMQTGEGKTLTATLPVAAAALAGIPTHVVTVNDYLTERDAQLMSPVYQRLGLGVGVIIQGLTVAERKAQYAMDIVYCTNNELAFDYLKDGIQLNRCCDALQLHALRSLPADNSQMLDSLMLRGLHFAVVDEADGVFMDEATTPLVISGDAAPQLEQQSMYLQAFDISQTLQQEQHFIIRQPSKQIEFTPIGEQEIEQLTKGLSPLWHGRTRRLELVKQALTAQYLFLRDKHYLVDEEKVVIIDEHTGRRMPDRTWEQGLHQLIEIKEGCELSDPRVTLASISFQNFFRFYHHLSGMTGTADEVKSEFWRVYELPVVDVPTHKSSQRQQYGCNILLTKQQKWHEIARRIKEINSHSLRPILVGTQSLQDSEVLSQLLQDVEVQHQVLNARQDQAEAEVVKQAGLPSTVTIATSMAGRGTDIKLDSEVEKEGGLHVIITGLHDSSRVDRQLEGRCARQGDRGSVEFVLSLEEEIITPYWGKMMRIIVLMPLPNILKNKLLFSCIRRCQKRIENQQQQVRKQLLKHDEQQQDVLSFSLNQV